MDIKLDEDETSGLGTKESNSGHTSTGLGAIKIKSLLSSCICPLPLTLVRFLGLTIILMLLKLATIFINVCCESKQKLWLPIIHLFPFKGNCTLKMQNVDMCNCAYPFCIYTHVVYKCYFTFLSYPCVTICMHMYVTFLFVCFRNFSNVNVKSFFKSEIKTLGKNQ